MKVLPPSELGTFKEAIEEGSCLLLDVREMNEYEAGHIPRQRSGPYRRWPNGRRIEPGRAIIVYCRTSKRSRRCADISVPGVSGRCMYWRGVSTPGPPVRRGQSE